MAHMVVLLVLIFALLIAAIIWILVYALLIEKWLKKLFGYLFGITIGGSEFQKARYVRSVVVGWTILEPETCGCLFRTFIWLLGGLMRSIFMGIPIAGLLVVISFVIMLTS